MRKHIPALILAVLMLLTWRTAFGQGWRTYRLLDPGFNHGDFAYTDTRSERIILIPVYVPDLRGRHWKKTWDRPVCWMTQDRYFDLVYRNHLWRLVREGR